MHISSLEIENFRGIKNLVLRFRSGTNVLIGPNGSRKTAVLDALRLFFGIGQYTRDFFVSKADFYQDPLTGLRSESIKIRLYFAGLSAQQKGAFYEYLEVLPDQSIIATFTMEYTLKPDGRAMRSYYSGAHSSTSPNSETFQLFKHYYLEAYRDCTRDTFSQRGNVVGSLVTRLQDDESTQTLEDIFANANEKLLGHQKVKEAAATINENIKQILPNSVENLIAFRIDDKELDTIVNVIKLFLPFDKDTLTGEGFGLRQNSLGHNNLLYIASVLGDIKASVSRDPLVLFGLIIEEPEAHLHPQVQVNLFRFLKSCEAPNGQVFLSTHSPTLTSRVPLDRIILLNDGAYHLKDAFKGRDAELLESPTKQTTKRLLKTRKNQLERYLDVTRSQLLYSSGVILVEGISEALLLPVLARAIRCPIDEHQVEVVNVDGTSFHPFLYLFNSADESKRLPMPLSVMTDGDKFPSGNRNTFSWKKLTQDERMIDELIRGISNGTTSQRVENLRRLGSNNPRILLCHNVQTFELSLVASNLPRTKSDIENGLMLSFLDMAEQKFRARARKIREFLAPMAATLTDVEHQQIAMLIWKALPPKAEFAQGFSIYASKCLKDDEDCLRIPKYIKDAIHHAAGIAND